MITSETIAGILAVLLVLGVFVLLGMGQEIPNWLIAGFGLVLGFFFGNQSSSAKQLKGGN